ncbi:hypothetical protein [Pseudomonas sp. R16(2017)]|uniref:hypothetical protein n=1 Tax=Pseudomonas sp. R16(2017) TaxID=1981704 RepID=UPI000A1F9A98|nr:hypothetical protein [Pseudomonas sp. R16(2017)]
MNINITQIHYNDIKLNLSADDLKAALVAKYGDAASQIQGQDVVLMAAGYDQFFPESGVTFTFAQPLEGHNG